MAKDVSILNTEVVIVGGGPFGLMLAIELGRRNVTTLLYDAKNGTVYNPQANATQARTMEYFRRLGIADEIRALGMPARLPYRHRLFHEIRSSRTGALSITRIQQGKCPRAIKSGLMDSFGSSASS